MRLITATQKKQNRTAKITAPCGFENGLTAFTVSGEVLANNCTEPHRAHP